ncbi:hypothetical protein D9M71_271640 [compost metagenome]
MRQASVDTFDHLTDRFGLIACRLETGDELKLGHWNLWFHASSPQNSAATSEITDDTRRLYL